MARVGLLAPIVVRRSRRKRGRLVLVAGLTRLTAAKKLCWVKIDVIVQQGASDARTSELMENLFRKRGTVLSRADDMAELAELLKAEGVQLAPPAGGRQPHDKGLSKAAKALGVTREQLRRARLIASITPEGKRAARRAGFANNQQALLKIAKEPPDKQVEKVRELKAASKPGAKGAKSAAKPSDGEAKSSRASAAKKRPPANEQDGGDGWDDGDDADGATDETDDVEDEAADERHELFWQLKRTWKKHIAPDWEKAPEPTRIKFVTDVLGYVVSSSSGARLCLPAPAGD